MLEWVNKFNVYDLYSKGREAERQSSSRTTMISSQVLPAKIAW
jgi:hypothetical protein